MSITIFSQNVSKKCKDCGKSIAQCQYKGKHPKCAACYKLKEQCKYNGRHPSCQECGRTIGSASTPCKYNGSHPENTGYDVTFSCNAPSAIVYIDGKNFGNIGGSKYLKTGSHSINVSAEGYESYVQDILVNKSTTHFNLILTKITTGTISGHDWVDIGLSVKWATTNIGAKTPEEYGGYYSWGETKTKNSYTYANCYDCTNSSYPEKETSWSLYKKNGVNEIAPTSGQDAAHENWGGTWRLPTNKEFEELQKKCKWKWTSINNINGYIVTGPNGNSIFLPAGGFRSGNTSDKVGSYGYYWSNTLSPNHPNGALDIYFNKETHGTYFSYRSIGKNIRPVSN